MIDASSPLSRTRSCSGHEESGLPYVRGEMRRMRNNCDGRHCSETIVRGTMGKLLAVLIISALAGLSLSLPVGAGEELIYDRDYNLKYRIDGSGRVYDTDWNRKGRVEKDKVYDENYNLKYRIEGDKVYDKNWNLKYRRDGDRIYDRNYNLKGRIKER